MSTKFDLSLPVKQTARCCWLQQAGSTVSRACELRQSARLREGSCSNVIPLNIHENSVSRNKSLELWRPVRQGPIGSQPRVSAISVGVQHETLSTNMRGWRLLRCAATRQHTSAAEKCMYPDIHASALSATLISISHVGRTFCALRQKLEYRRAATSNRRLESC